MKSGDLAWGYRLINGRLIIAAAGVRAVSTDGRSVLLRSRVEVFEHRRRVLLAECHETAMGAARAALVHYRALRTEATNAETQAKLMIRKLQPAADREIKSPLPGAGRGARG